MCLGHDNKSSDFSFFFIAKGRLVDCLQGIDINRRDSRTIYGLEITSLEQQVPNSKFLKFGTPLYLSPTRFNRSFAGQYR